ncbi:hypothetical protein [Haloarchaeobius sp. FL176]|uniref:hypothetical protein n=1 Tax=Haloarchaeobius sp. FL176 TaxID=2967129 RepID=UPI002148D42F|nr:hypothetical protein [Haloarchaeobius sp. FL176]
MPNEWKVLTRVIERGSEFEFTDETYEQYITAVSAAYADATASRDGTPTADDEYHSFLVEDVLADGRVLAVLEDVEAPPSKISAINDGTIDLDASVDQWHEIRFTFDELLDLLMLLKLVRDYSELSSSKKIESRFKLQKLVYLVNHNLVNQENYSLANSRFGLLSKTGYRYRYANRESGPYSEDVYEDKNRLFAWELIDEPVVGSDGTGEVAERNHQYAIELSAQGEIMVERFYDQIESTDSFIISAWNQAQTEEIQKVAQMTHSELTEYVNQIDDVRTTTKGGELLIGPENKFQETEIEYLEDLRGEFENARA